MNYKEKKAGDLKLKHLGRQIVAKTDNYKPTEGKLISVTAGGDRLLELKMSVDSYGGHYYAYETVSLNDIIHLLDKA